MACRLGQEEQQLHRFIKDGDVAIVYERIDAINFVSITENGSFKNKFGEFKFKDWIGRPYGSKMFAASGNGWVCVLALTPELWTVVLRHRTQILYVADISMVCLHLELKPGYTVLESGTGSGSLTHSLARAVAPTGHVETFEFHEQRAQIASEEFKKNGIEHLVTVTHRDIEANGFPEEFCNKADAAFLDLPGPWKAIPSAVSSLRPDGVICSFSPCIEQVQRACEALHNNGCRDIQTYEVLLREYELSHDRQLTDIDGQLEQQVAHLSSSAPSKRPKLAEDSTTKDGEAITQTRDDEDGGATTDAETLGQSATKKKERAMLARPGFAGRGHTGYLTFARKAVQVNST